MIIEWLVAVGSSIAGFIASLFPVWEPPAWFTDVGPQIQGLLTGADGMGVWVDFHLAGGIAGVVVTTYLVSFGIKLFLRAGSHIPQFGGAG